MTNPKALAVFLDAARECFGELAPEVAKWVEHPEAVRELLRSHQYAFDPMESVCSSCGQFHDLSHLQDCPIAAAWRALGDPRGAADIERAHEEALRQDGLTMRTIGRWDGDRYTPIGPEGGWVGIALNDAPQDGLVEVRLSPDAGFVSHADLERIGREAFEREGVRPIAVIDPMTGPAMARDFAGVEVSLDATLDPDEYRLTSDRMRVGPGGPIRMCRFGARAWVAMQRSTSDARGMEAVEDEARGDNWQSGPAAGWD